MFALATLPNPGDMLTSVGVWSSPLFNDLLPFAIYAIGFIVGIFLVRFIIHMVVEALHHKPDK